MDYDNRNVISNPHWISDGSQLVSDPNCPRAYIMPVKALNIIWGNDPRFWQWSILSPEEIRATGFQEGKILLQVNWIEVTGKIPISSMLKNVWSTKFEIFYVIKFREDAFGWHSVPIKFKVKINGKEIVNKSVILENYNKEKNQLWHEISGGEFTVLSKDSAGVVEFGMFEVESDWWKGGIVLSGIKIKPQ